MRMLRALPEVEQGETLRDLTFRCAQAFTYRELAGMFSEGQLRSALRRGDIVRLAPDAYVAAEHSESFFARADAALSWAGPHAALSGASALRAWSVLTEDPPMEVAVPADCRMRPPEWLRVRRVSYPYSPVMASGLLAVPPAVAIVQSFGDLPKHTRTSTVYTAVTRELASVEDLFEALATVPRVKDRRPLTRIVDAAARGAESWLEQHSLERVFCTQEFAGFIRQHVVLSRHANHRLDMYDPSTGLAIELDSGAHHSGAARKRDVRRDAVLAGLGILTIRLTYADLVNRPDWCREVVRDAMQRRRSR